MSFDPDTLEQRDPQPSPTMEEDQEDEPKEQPTVTAATKGPVATGNANPSAMSQGKKPGSIP